MSLLIARLGLASRLLGVVATNARSERIAATLADQAGLPLLARVRLDSNVARARERGEPPPERTFAALGELAGVSAR